MVRVRDPGSNDLYAFGNTLGTAIVGTLHFTVFSTSTLRGSASSSEFVLAEQVLHWATRHGDLSGIKCVDVRYAI